MRSTFAAMAVLLLMAGSVMAETPLDVNQAVSRATAQNLSLRRQKLSLDAAQRAVDNSWNTFLPSVTASTGLSRSSYWTEGNNWSTWLSLSLGMSVSPSVLEQTRQVTLAYESQSITYEKAKRSLELNVRKAFYALLLYDEKVRLASQRIDRARQSLDETKKKYNAGLVPDLDVLSAEVSYEELKPGLESATTTRENALDAFKLLLGIDLAESVSLGGDLQADAQAISLEAVTATASGLVEKETLDVKSLVTSLQIAQSSKKAKVLDSTLPSASVSLSTSPSYLFGAGGAFNDSGSSRLTISFDVDGLIPGSSTQASIATAEDSIRSLESQIRGEKLTLATNVQSYLRSIRTAASSRDAYTSNVALAQKSYELTHDAYLRGLKTLSDVESASASLDEARVSVLGECYTLLAATLDLEYVLDLDLGTIAR